MYASARGHPGTKKAASTRGRPGARSVCPPRREDIREQCHQHPQRRPQQAVEVVGRGEAAGGAALGEDGGVV